MKSLLLIGYYKKQIYCLKEKLNNLNPTDSNFENLIELQRDILKLILHTEEKITAKKNDFKALKIQLRNNKFSKEDAKKLKQKISIIESKIDSYNFLLYLWKCFGDGIVFKYINKWNLKRLMFETDTSEIKQNSGFIRGKEGLDKEFNLVLNAIYNGVPAILSDLTNTVRYGDVCLLGGNDPYVIEVKSSKNTNKRVERQYASINNIHNYLKNDIGDISGFEKMKRVSLETSEIHFNDIFNNAIQTSLLGKSSSISPEEGVLYVIINSSSDIEYVELIKGIAEPIVFMLNQSKTEQVWGNYYPFTLSLKTPETLYSFLKGEIYVIVILDGFVMKKIAESIGYKLEVVMDGSVGLIFTKDVDGINEPIKIVASEHYFRRIAYEFLSLKWFLESQRKNLLEIENELLKSV